MKIAFDALPLLGQKSGIGFCATNQIREIIQLLPENEFFLNYFAVKQWKEKQHQLQPYLQENVTLQGKFFPAYAYRTISAFFPVPYQSFFGKADLTHFFNYIVPPGVSGKTVVTVHDMVYKAFPETVRTRTRQMLAFGLEQSMNRADRIITDSEFSRSEIQKYYPEVQEKIRVVPCGVDRTHFRPVREVKFFRRIQKKYHLPENYFLYTGTIEPRKNLITLISAYARFVRSHVNPPKLVLSGAKGWLYESLLQKIQELHLQKEIIFTEYIQDEDLPVLISFAKAFIFPSLYEGFGLPPLEAMACGTPVLVSNAASLPEVVGDAALMVHPKSVSAMEKALHFLFTNPALREKLSRKGQQRAELFSWENSAKLLLQVYQEILPEV